MKWPKKKKLQRIFSKPVTNSERKQKKKIFSLWIRKKKGQKKFWGGVFFLNPRSSLDIDFLPPPIWNFIYKMVKISNVQTWNKNVGKILYEENENEKKIYK